MRRFLPWLILCSILVAADRAPAQTGCGIFRDITIQKYGTGCPGAFLNAPELVATLDPGPCALAIEMKAPTGCCNVYFGGWVLLLGAQKLEVPVLRTGCTLYVQPLVDVWLPSTVTKVAAPIPQDPALAGTTLYLQGAARYFGFYFGPDLSQGVAVTFR